MTEIIEGSAVEIIPEVRAVAVVQQPGQSLVAHSTSHGPADMVGVAAELAGVLKDIVERQKLYAVIQGKKYPQVEAWMTIARLDNVVAREAQPPIRHDDGSYEAFAELIRLSDAMVIGASSALCGTPDDKPWASRPEPARRSMAQTRAVSRAFRAHYSWIMALAGYEPTPAEEMPVDTSGQSSSPAPRSTPAAAPGGGGTFTVQGRAVAGNGNGMDMMVRQSPDGDVIGFKLMDVEGHPDGKRSTGVRLFGPLATAAGVYADTLAGQHISVTGTLRPESFDKDGRTTRYTVLIGERVETPEWTLPAVSVAPSAPEGTPAAVNDLDDLAW